MEDRIIISDSIRDGFLVYEMFGDGEDGELVREKVQTWICDNRMDVTSAVSTTLRAKKVTFGDWFRSSEENRSPDETNCVLSCKNVETSYSYLQQKLSLEHIIKLCLVHGQ